MGVMVVDILLVALLLLAALRGWHKGAVVRGLQLVGLLGAGALAYHFVPGWLNHVDAVARPGIARSLVLIAAVWVAAVIGEAVLGRIAMRLMRGRHGSRPDSFLGAIASMLVTAFVVWFCATAAAPALPASIGRQVSDSRGLRAIDSVMPDQPRQWASKLATSLNANRFPDVFSGLSPDPAPSVPAPDAGVTSTAAVAKAAASVVKVLASSTSCGASEGSGWVVAQHRVVTNAHVVAGSSDVTVQVAGVGPRLSASVVAFDPEVDLAILDVPSLAAPALQRTSATLSKGTSTVVAGFPLDGSYTVVPARVGNEIDATGRDIYASRLVTRTIYSLNTTVKPGNSGGPLLTTSGTVAGTVFARSTTSSTTGYALSDAETDSLLDRATALSTPVSTQSCVAG